MFAGISSCVGLIALFLLGAASCADAATPDRHWVAGWTRGLIADEPARTPLPMRHVSLRTAVRLTAGGSALRLRFSNAFGTAPLTIDTVTVAPTGAGAAGALPVTVGGARRFTIAAGDDLRSDPIAMPTEAGTVVHVTFHLDAAPSRASIHPTSGISVLVVPGPDGAMTTRPLRAVYQLAAVEVATPPDGTTVAVLGDSIVGAGGSRLDGRGRWTDILAARLHAAGRRHVGVANLGIAGGRIAAEGTGPSGVARLDRDVLSQPNLSVLIVAAGVNDLGKLSREQAVTPQSRQATIDAIIAGYRQIVTKARARGVRVLGATILPFGGTPRYRSDAAAEADRSAVNAWIRAPGNFDGVVDFDRVMRNPVQPDRLDPAIDSGDHLHPSSAGQQRLGTAVPLVLLDPGDAKVK